MLDTGGPAAVRAPRRQQQRLTQLFALPAQILIQVTADGTASLDWAVARTGHAELLHCNARCQEAQVLIRASYK